MRRSGDAPKETTDRNSLFVLPRRRWSATLWVLLALVGVVIGLLGRVPVPVVDVQWLIPAKRQDEYAPRTERRPDNELLFVYIGSSTCGPSNSDDVRESVHYAKRQLSELAEADTVAFAAIGIATDLDSANGLAHLRTLGLWDEVVSGRSWRNAGSEKYVYRDMPGVAATPQVVIVLRSVEHGRWSTPIEKVVVRKVGVREIGDWVARGLPLSFF